MSGGEGERLGGAHSVLPAPATTIDCLGTALDNLALAAANDTTVLQQLRSENLALTTSNATLTVTAANKKLSEALAKVLATTPGTPGTPQPPNTLGIIVGLSHRISQNHTSITCGAKAAGHQDTATASNTMGRSEKDKGWITRCT